MIQVGEPPTNAVFPEINGIAGLHVEFVESQRIARAQRAALNNSAGSDRRSGGIEQPEGIGAGGGVAALDDHLVVARRKQRRERAVPKELV